MLIKLCFQDYVYLYHGKLAIRDLHKFIQDNITDSVVVLKWIDLENEEITLIRDEDLDYVANLTLTNFRILIQKSFKDSDSPQKDLKLEQQVSFGVPNNLQPRFIHRTQTQNLDQQTRHKKSTSEDMSQDVLLDNVVEGILEDVYPEFGLEKSEPIMIKSQNLFHMRESIPNYCVNRDTIFQQQQQQQAQQYQQTTTSAILQSRRKSTIPFDKQLYCDYCSKIFHSDSGFYKCQICRDFEICLECKERQDDEQRQGNSKQLFTHDHSLEFGRNQESNIFQY